MMKAKKRGRVAILVACLTAGAFLLQLGPCTVMALSTGTAAFNFGSLLDGDGRFLGIFAMCGRPNVLYVDVNGIPDGGILYTEDDLIYDCPYTEIVVPD